MRALVVSTIVLSAALPAAAEPARFVDLDRPGVMDAIARDNPEHFQKITEIVRLARVQPCETLPKILKVRMNVFDFECSSYTLLTSLPPKRHLSFKLDDVAYATNAIQYHLADGKIQPAK